MFVGGVRGASVVGGVVGDRESGHTDVSVEGGNEGEAAADDRCNPRAFSMDCFGNSDTAADKGVVEGCDRWICPRERGALPVPMPPTAATLRRLSSCIVL